MKYSKFYTIYTLIALLCVIIATLFTWNIINMRHDTLYKHIEHVLHQQRELYQIYTDKTLETLEQIASIYAGNKRVQVLLQQGREAIEREGGGAGGTEAARIRSELYNLVGPNWQEMTAQYNTRQLHFHFPEGSTSFLRVHSQNKFGDSLASLRHTIVHANTNLTKVRGFEVGRIYAGLRGVVPIFFRDSTSSEQHHVGSVEAGMSYLPVIQQLEKEFHESDHTHKIHAVALLDKNHLRGNVWPEFLERLSQNNPDIDGLFIEASAHTVKAKEFISLQGISEAIRNQGVYIFDKLQPPYALISIPLHDFLSDLDQGRGNIGHIVIWTDISYGLKMLQATVIRDIAVALVVVILILIFLFYALRSLNRYFDQLISVNTPPAEAGGFKLRLKAI